MLQFILSGPTFQSPLKAVLLNGAAPPRPVGPPPPRPGDETNANVIFLTTPAAQGQLVTPGRPDTENTFSVFVNEGKKHGNQPITLSQVPSTPSHNSLSLKPRAPKSPHETKTETFRTIHQSDLLQAPPPPQSDQKQPQEKPHFQTDSNQIHSQTLRPEQLQNNVKEIQIPQHQNTFNSADKSTRKNILPQENIRTTPIKAVEFHNVQQEIIGQEQSTKTKTKFSKNLDNLGKVLQKQKTFQTFHSPIVLQGRLVSESSVPSTVQDKPKQTQAQLTSRTPGTHQRVNTKLVKQQFTAFKKPGQPSPKPEETLEPQSDTTDIENKFSPGNNKEQVSDTLRPETSPQNHNTFFSSNKITKTTRKPRAFTKLATGSFQRNSGIANTNTAIVSEPEKTKQIIFKDSTIAVSPGSILIPEAFTPSNIEQPKPTQEIPFDNQSELNIPIMIEEKAKPIRGIKVMTEIEFEQQFGGVQSHGSREPENPQNTFFQVSAMLKISLFPISKLFVSA